MAFRFKRKESVHRGVRRLGRNRVKRMLRALEGCERLEAVHEVRTGIKQLRALLRLVCSGLRRSDYRCCVRLLKKAAAQLAPVRDAQVKANAWAALRKDNRLKMRRRDLDEVGQAFSDQCRVERQGLLQKKGRGIRHEVQCTLKQLRKDLTRIRMMRSSWRVIATGLKRSYREGRRGLRLAQKSGTPECLHQWRKRVKDLLFQVTLLRCAAPEKLKTVELELKGLSDVLGTDHDLWLLMQSDIVRHFREGHQAFTLLLRQVVECRESELRAEALKLGRVYEAKPSDFCKQLHRHWHRWRTA